MSACLECGRHGGDHFLHCPLHNAITVEFHTKPAVTIEPGDRIKEKLMNEHSGYQPKVGEFVYGTVPVDYNFDEGPTRAWVDKHWDLNSWGLGVGFDRINPKGSGWHIQFWLDVGPLSLTLTIGK